MLLNYLLQNYDYSYKIHFDGYIIIIITIIIYHKQIMDFNIN